MRTLTLFMATLVSVLGLSFAAQADPTVDLLIGGMPTVDTSVGATVTVNVVITLTGTELMDGYQLSIQWDGTELAFNGGSLNSTPPGGWLDGSWGEYQIGNSLIGPVGGTVVGGSVGAGSYNVGNLQFTVQAGLTTDGAGDIMAYLDAPNSFSSDFIGDAAGGSYGAITFNGAGVNVIPEPTTASLLGLGLIGLTLAGRRRN